MKVRDLYWPGLFLSPDGAEGGGTGTVIESPAGDKPDVSAELAAARA